MLLSTAHAMAGYVVGDGDEAITPGPDMRGPGALYRIYDVADGWVFLAVTSEREWSALVGALSSVVDLGQDPRFTTAEERQCNDEALAAVLAGVFVQRKTAEWQHLLTDRDVACVAVLTDPPEALLMSDEVGRAGRYITDVVHPIFDRHPRLAPVVRFSRSDTSARAGGLCGDATDTVLSELGYSADRITELRAINIIGGGSPPQGS
jgi:crotonobetainyl-CoA:carnitine CoA-transferase CaiB-like acyl-CoA transferase